MNQHVPDAVRARVDSLHDSVTEHWDELRAELREIKPKLRGWLHLAPPRSPWPPASCSS